MYVLPFPYRQLLQIHRSIFKLHPFCYLGQASVPCIPHAMLFFRIRKDTLYFLLSLLVQVFVFWRMSGVFCHFYIVAPYMSGDDLFILHVAGALFSGRTVCTDISSTLVFSVAVTIGGGIMEGFVFGTDDVIIIAVIDILIPWMTAFLSFWSGIGGG